MENYSPLRADAPFANGRYTIRGVLSKGGMGAVYLAADHATFDRTVVVKEMLDYYDASDPQQVEAARARFLQEARTLAALNHPAIPQIIDSFQDGPHNYIVMEYIAGRDLAQRLTHRDDNAGVAQRGQPYALHDVLRWGVALCEALAYLHSREPDPVVHHDIKPANVLVEDGADKAWLVDFGTAKARLVAQPGSSAGVQQSSIYGTQGYAAPEQYRGQSEPRSDVYALAATLYHLATDDDPRDHPFSFPQLASLGALGPVLQAALAHDIDKRPTALVLRQQLAGLAAAEVATTLAPSAAERTTFEASAPAVFPAKRSAIAVLLAVLVVALGLGLWFAARPSGREAATPALVLTPQLPPTPSPLAGGVPAPTPTARPLPTTVPQVAPQEALQSVAVIAGPDTSFSCIALTAKGDVLAVGGDSRVAIWSVSNQRQLVLLAGDTNRVAALAFSPDGTLLLSASNNDIRLWRVRDGALLWTMTLAGAAVRSVAFSPDGQTIVATGGDNTASILRTSDGTTQHTLLGHGGVVNSVAFSSGGEQIATGSALGLVELWRANDGALLRTIRASKTPVYAVAFGADGALVAGGGEQSGPSFSALGVWRTDDGSMVRSFPEDGGITSIAWNPDGQRLVSVDFRNAIRVWRVSDGALLYTLDLHSAPVNLVVWSADGATLASSDNDGQVRVWRAPEGTR